MVQLRDGSIICSSYGWARVNDEVADSFDETIRHGNFYIYGRFICFIRKMAVILGKDRPSRRLFLETPLKMSSAILVRRIIVALCVREGMSVFIGRAL